MPVTSFALLVVSGLAVLLLLAVAVKTWGFVTIFPLVLLLVLAIRWAMMPVSHDDGPV